MNRISKILRQVDFVSDHAELYGNDSSTRLQSVCGGILSILCYFSIFASAGFFTFKFFSLDRPLIIMNSEYRDNLVINNFTSYPFLFRLSDEFGLPLPEEERIFNPNLQWCRSSNKDGKVIQEYDVFNLRRCNSTHIEAMPSIYKSAIKDISSYYCTDWGNKTIDLKGLYGGPDNYTFTYYRIRHCVNGTTGTNCFPINKIYDQLKSVYLDTVFVDRIITSSSEVPFIDVVSTERYQISNTFFRRLWISLRTVDYETDFGIIFEEITKQTFFQIESSFISISTITTEMLESGRSFLGITLSNYKYKVNYKRSFMKAQELFANIGGIVKAITIAATLINISFGSTYSMLGLIESLPVYTSYSLDKQVERCKYLDKQKKVNLLYLDSFKKRGGTVEIDSKSVDNDEMASRSENDLNLKIKKTNEVVTNNYTNKIKDTPQAPANQIINIKTRLALSITEKFCPFLCNGPEMLRYKVRVKHAKTNLKAKNVIAVQDELEYLKGIVLSSEQCRAFDVLFKEVICQGTLSNKSIYTHISPFKLSINDGITKRLNERLNQLMEVGSNN